MEQTLTLYSNPMSRGRITRWMLEEVGAPYTFERTDYGGALQTPAFRAMNPMGKVPVLRHGAAVVSETAAICAYLADAFPSVSLAPAPSSPARGRYYRLMFFAAGPLEAATTNRALGLEIPPDRAGMVGYGSFARTMEALEQSLGDGPYLLGESFSAADVYLGSQIGWGLRFGSIEARPAFAAYWARLADRPAALRANALDDALLAPPAPIA